MRLLPRKQHPADSLQHTAIRRPRSPARFRPHPSALILVLAFPCLLLCVSPETATPKPELEPRPEVPASSGSSVKIVGSLPAVYVGPRSLKGARVRSLMDEVPYWDRHPLTRDPISRPWHSVLPSPSESLGLPDVDLLIALGDAHGLILVALWREALYFVPDDLPQLLWDAGLHDTRTAGLAVVVLTLLSQRFEDPKGVWSIPHENIEDLFTQGPPLMPAVEVSHVVDDSYPSVITTQHDEGEDTKDTIWVPAVRVGLAADKREGEFLVVFGKSSLRGGGTHAFPNHIRPPRGVAAGISLGRPQTSAD